MKTKERTLLEVLGGLALLAVFMLLVIGQTASATNRNDDGQRQDQDQYQDQHQDQTQDQETNVDVTTGPVSVEAAAAGGAANNEGNSLSVNTRYENGPANLTLIPNNNTERCLRVFGFSFGNKDGSGMFGVPWRSKQCDYKGFASDADAQGNLELGWFWRCHMKSAYKVFRDKNESAEAAIAQCHDQMVGTVELLTRVNELEDTLEFERNERTIERANAKTARERAASACEESKDRILTGCVRK